MLHGSTNSSPESVPREALDGREKGETLHRGRCDTHTASFAHVVEREKKEEPRSVV